MELNDALSKVQSLSNFFKGLQDIEAILQAARVAQQLQAERDAAAEKSRQDMVFAKTELQKFRDDTTPIMNEMRTKLTALQDSYTEKSAALDAKLAEQEANVTAAIQEARRKQAAAEAEFEAAISSGYAREAELAKQIKDLEKSLNALKSKAAAL